ncbi:NAD-dependent epimerase/dehydratase family protein [Pseudenhygromyxa sp. WMMC2535]|uniref:NAD-dependent epimerase/dehydratase family protein n=1 Tax=Pseudenhygromyxa sp. WMMC2535 TaxID=2712867 RepID=UPI0015574CD3|nr:NAD-dependent epimerase/dehydratase family protein [Pseudenhygromyxa sp. WMMC2535]NVB43482.1 NAD-dependent epimerase/dehydratase family protein [Pseudenhygromyxa sp. WMMC2535]
MKVLVTGIAGAHAQHVALRLVERGHEVLGIDVRPWQGAPRGVKMFQTDVRKRPAADVFRVHRPDVVIHMATVTHFDTSAEQRYRVNLRGTQAVFRHCEEFGVRNAVFVGRHTIYGAAADAPLYRTEDEPPLAVSTFPELADLVAADLYASRALWSCKSMRTAVLRCVYALGPSGRGTLASFLAGPRVPMALGFDPLFHVMHEADTAAAIVAAVEHEIAGVFNVAGPPPVPLSILCQATGRTPVHLPEGVLPRVLGRFGLPRLPKGAIGHLKHPVVVDDKAFIAATGFTYQWDEHATMNAFRSATILREDRGL